jgi:hypothetical protein
VDYCLANDLADQVQGDGKLVIPMKIETILAFLGSIMSKPGRKDAQPSYSAVNNYVSAIKFAYSERCILLPASDNARINDLLAGRCKP